MNTNAREGGTAATFPEWQHVYRAEAPHKATGSRIRVTAGLHWIPGNRRPYFSVTCAILEPRRGGLEHVGGGAAHDDILRAWPELAPVIALHLSDDDGAPMHAEAKGVYHLGFGRYSELNIGTAARHFRITEAEAEALRESITVHRATVAPGPYGAPVVRRWVEYDAEKYRAAVDAMRPRWKAEAREAIALLEGLRATTAGDD